MEKKNVRSDRAKGEISTVRKDGFIALRVIEAEDSADHHQRKTGFPHCIASGDEQVGQMPWRIKGARQAFPKLVK